MTPDRFQKLKDRLSRRQPDLTVLAEEVHKAHNISAVLRTADAVGIQEIHAVSSAGEMRRHHMISGGSKKWVDVAVHPDIHTACATLHGAGFRILAAHPVATAVDYREVDYTGRTAILLGAELDGVSAPAAALADGFVRIPMEGMVASLNVSVAAALLLYEARRQREAAGLYAHSRLAADVFARTLFEWAYPEIAARCVRQKIPYPPLSDDGELLENPLAPGPLARQLQARPLG